MIELKTFVTTAAAVMTSVEATKTVVEKGISFSIFLGKIIIKEEVILLQSLIRLLTSPPAGDKELQSLKSLSNIIILLRFVILGTFLVMVKGSQLALSVLWLVLFVIYVALRESVSLD